jgi:hypothetical protein
MKLNAKITTLGLKPVSMIFDFKWDIRVMYEIDYYNNNGGHGVPQRLYLFSFYSVPSVVIVFIPIYYSVWLSLALIVAPFSGVISAMIAPADLPFIFPRIRTTISNWSLSRISAAFLASIELYVLTR